MKKIVLLASISLLSALASTHSVYASFQDAVNDPTLTPDVVASPIEKKATKIQMPAAPKSGSMVPKEAYKTYVNLKDIVFQGSSVYTKEQLKEYVKFSPGEQVPVSYLYELARGVVALYRKDGYFLTDAVLPPQRIENGIARIDIIEGYIDSISLANEIDREDSFIPDVDLLIAYANQITLSAPLNRKDIERYLLLMNDLPGLKVASEIKPSPDKVGAAQLVLYVEQDTFNGSISANNRGNQTLGKMRSTVSLNFNSLTSRSEQTSLVYSTVKPFGNGRLNFISLQQQEYFGNKGLYAQFNASWSDSLLGGDLEPTDTKGETNRLDVHVNYPWVRSRKYNVLVRAGLVRQEAMSEILGIRTAKDTVYMLDASLLMSGLAKSNITWKFEGGFTKGINIFDASTNGDNGLSRQGGEPQFSLLTASFDVNKAFNSYVQARVRIEGQYTGDNLLSMSEFRFGGHQMGRAYNSSSLVGDKGVNVMTELSTSLSKRYRISAYGFFDKGYAWDNANPGAGHSSISSYGAGLRGVIMKKLWYDATLAIPLNTIANTGIEKNNAEFYFNLGFAF